MTPELLEFLRKAFESGATDVHIRHGKSPRLRLGGELREAREIAGDGFNVTQLAKSMLGEKDREVLKNQRIVQVVHDVSPKLKLRATFTFDQGKLYFTGRLLPAKVRSWDMLGVPKLAMNFLNRTQGLILVSGPLCSGKTSTMISFLSYLNQFRREHIIYMDELMEYRPQSGNCIVTLRQVGKDTTDYVSGLRYALREDPDVIAVGEVRDFQSADIALSIAETGHLMIAGVSTVGTLNSIQRVLNSFPSSMAQDARLKMSAYLIGCLSQVLVPGAQSLHPVPVFEVLTATASIQNAIRLDKTLQLKAETSRSIKGVSITFEDYAKELKSKGLIPANIDLTDLIS